MAKPHSVVKGIYERVRDKVFYLRSNKDAPDLIKTDARVLARSIANDIHDAPTIWTEYASIDAVAHRLKQITELNSKIKEPTRDHFRSRQRGGLKLVELIMQCINEDRQPTQLEVSAVIRLFRYVHYITATENQHLKKWMGNGTLDIKYTHEQAYRMAKIELIKIEDDLFSKSGRKPAAWIKHKKDKYLPLIKHSKVV